VPIVLKPGSLNLLEPSGPVKACNEIALPFNNKTIEITDVKSEADELSPQFF
jgi:hypothetical protein